MGRQYDAIVSLTRDAKKAEARWVQIADNGGASLCGVVITSDEASVAAGAISWVVKRLEAIEAMELDALEDDETRFITFGRVDT